MARRRSSRAPRFLLRPIEQEWFSSPGRAHAVVRFALWAGWLISTEPETRVFHTALLAPEMPISVLPRALSQELRIVWRATSDPQVVARPAPRWHGIPCTFVTTTARFLDSADGGEAVDLPIQFLLPDRDPLGP
jgi:hypothetical protein